MIHCDPAGPGAPGPASFGAFPLQLHRLDGPVRASFGFIRDAVFGQLDRWAQDALGPAESAGLRRCRTSKRELSYLAGRFAARQAVALYLNGRGGDQAFEVSSGVFNQPIVRCPAFEPPAITISHTDDLAVAIAHDAGHVLGVDVEQMRVFSRATVDCFLTDAERRLAAALPGDEPGQLTAVWTIKEALSKALRCGLSVPLGILEISGLDIDGNGCVRSDFSNFQQYKCQTWVLRTHVLSIAMPRSTDVTFDGTSLG
jgi:4'-phosphopantetheinyl transferase